MKIKFLAALALVPFIVGCSTSPLSVDLKPEAKQITVTNEKPKGNYELIAPVTVSHGRGCRDFGYLGSKEDAIKELKNKTSELRGDYAQITKVTQPHLDGGCFDNRYQITALVYRKSNHTQNTASLGNEERFTKKMRELKSLYDDGILTKAEYESQKAKLLKKGFNQ